MFDLTHVSLVSESSIRRLAMLPPAARGSS